MKSIHDNSHSIFLGFYLQINLSRLYPNMNFWEYTISCFWAGLKQTSNHIIFVYGFNDPLDFVDRFRSGECYVKDHVKYVGEDGFVL